jgi:hypothetical protein
VLGKPTGLCLLARPKRPKISVRRAIRIMDGAREQCQETLSRAVGDLRFTIFDLSFVAGCETNLSGLPI